MQVAIRFEEKARKAAGLKLEKGSLSLADDPAPDEVRRLQRRLVELKIRPVPRGAEKDPRSKRFTELDRARRDALQAALEAALTAWREEDGRHTGLSPRVWLHHVPRPQNFRLRALQAVADEMNKEFQLIPPLTPRSVTRYVKEARAMMKLAKAMPRVTKPSFGKV